VNFSKTLPVTLLCAFVLLERLQKELPAKAYGSAETCHRVFMAALILTNKLLFDVPIKNQDWAKYSQIYSLLEVNLMEKQFLTLIRFNIHLTDEVLWLQMSATMGGWLSYKKTHWRDSSTMRMDDSHKVKKMMDHHRHEGASPSRTNHSAQQTKYGCASEYFYANSLPTPHYGGSHENSPLLKTIPNYLSGLADENMSKSYLHAPSLYSPGFYFHPSNQQIPSQMSDGYSYVVPLNVSTQPRGRDMNIPDASAIHFHAPNMSSWSHFSSDSRHNMIQNKIPTSKLLPSSYLGKSLMLY